MKKGHGKDYSPIITEAIKRLPHGEQRLTLSEYPLSEVCLRGFYAPDFSEELKSDYRISSEDNELEEDYYEEISTIEKIMTEAGVPIGLADWQKGAKQEFAEKMHKGLNRRAYAIRMWDWYAIPWRYKGGLIHIIWSPRDLFGTPIIHRYPVVYFLTNLTSKEEEQAREFLDTSKKLKIWQTIGQIGILIIGILVLAWVL